MVILMETHCEFKRAEKIWNNLGYEPGTYSEAQGHSSEIWILVEKQRNFDVSAVDCFYQVVTISIKQGSNIRWCSAVYASPIPFVRDLLWEYLCTLRTTIQGPWLLMGDYNEILLPSEVCGVSSIPEGRKKWSVSLSNVG